MRQRGAFLRRACIVVSIGGLGIMAAAREPALPPGLGDGGGELALPAGLGGGGAQDEPALPSGLGTGGDSEPATMGEGEAHREPRLPVEMTGFADTRAGVRLQDDPNQAEDLPLAEARLQVDLSRRWVAGGFSLVADILYDGAADERGVDLATGQGWLDLRDANVTLTPVAFADVKIGRQILTWGTGDLLFVNDNFPKDWVSFFTGRDVEYLKAPSDALKASLFFDAFNADVVYTPQFDSDRFIAGRRISYFNAGLGRRAGEAEVVRTDRPDEWFRDDEVAARLYRNLHGYELAAYVYHGFWKSPAGSNPAGEATFPRLNVYGASARGRFLNGIGNLELGYQDSRDDKSGDDPMVRNSEWRLLAGYERDLAFVAKDFTLGLQYYLELMDDYDAYRRTLPEGAFPRDEDRHVVTLRLTKQLMQQNLELSCFAYYSPSDADAYLRPYAGYKLTDAWLVSVGGNIFLGEDAHTFFAQFEKNSNVYAAVRYSY